MEQPGGFEPEVEISPAQRLVVLENEPDVQKVLDGIAKMVPPTAKNRLLPRVAELASTVTSGEELIKTLLNLITEYSETTSSPTLAVEVQRLRLDDYLVALMPIGEELDDTRALLGATLARLREEENIAAEYKPKGVVARETKSKSPYPAPGRKTRRALAKPEESRTQAEKQLVKNYWAWIGRQGLQ